MDNLLVVYYDLLNSVHSPLEILQEALLTAHVKSTDLFIHSFLLSLTWI